jgi:hypothetical protein
MTHWHTIPPTTVERLSKVADLLLKFREAFQEISNLYHWSPAPNSPADQAAIELSSLDPLIADSRRENDHQLIAEVVRLFLLSASGHLGALASLYKSGEVSFSPPLLIRAVIENCAHAVWVLGYDQDEPSENRLARTYLEELLSAKEEKKNAGRMRGESDPSYITASNNYQTLKQRILDRFPGTTPESLGSNGLCLYGQKLPRLEESVVKMYELTEEYGGTINGKEASGIYGLLSNMTHPTLYTARQYRKRIDNPDVDHQRAYRQIGISSIENEARAALAAFYNALNYTVSYFGWPETVVADLEDATRRAIPDFFI